MHMAAIRVLLVTSIVLVALAVNLRKGDKLSGEREERAEEKRRKRSNIGKQKQKERGQRKKERPRIDMRGSLGFTKEQQ